MARNRTGSYTFSGKACDIEYRSERLQELTERARLCLASIDPAAVGPGSIDRGMELVELLSQVARQLRDTRPQKRSYVRGGKASVSPVRPSSEAHAVISSVVSGLELVPAPLSGNDRSELPLEHLEAAE